jgi:predicted GNAT family acetyltransferase
MDDAATGEGLELTLRDRLEAQRYEATAGDRLAGVAAYRPRPGAVVFTHTEVLPGWEGRGVGGRLVRAALDDLRARGLQAVPRCPFVAAWIRRHPEYGDLVPPRERGPLERRGG